MGNEIKAVAMVSKTFVKVTAEHDESGQVRPLLLTWTDGKRDGIDRVTDVRQAPSLRRGGLGMRYAVRGRKFFAFYGFISVEQQPEYCFIDD